MTLTDPATATMAYWFLDTLAIVHSPTPPLLIEVTVPAGGSPPLHVRSPVRSSSEQRERQAWPSSARP